MDYQKNVFAELVVKEVSRANPTYLAKFKIEKMMQFDATRHCMLSILKAYVDRRVLTQKAEDVIDDLMAGEKEKALLTTFIQSTQVKIKRQNEN